MENQFHLALEKNRLLSDVSIDNLDLTEIKGELIPLHEGEILYREADTADAVYLVASGEINLIKKKLLGVNKSFVYKEGDFFGYDEISEEMSRTSTAIVLQDSYLVALSRDEIGKLIEQNHIIKTNLLDNSDIVSPEDLRKEKTGEIESDTDTIKGFEDPDVNSFAESSKDDLIDQHDETIENDDSSIYEEKYEEIKDPETPEEVVSPKIEGVDEDVSDEPLFPDDDTEMQQEDDGTESGVFTKEDLQRIIKASQMVNSSINLDDVLCNIVNVAVDLTGADRGTLYLVDRKKNELWSKVAVGSEVKEIYLKMGEGLAGWAAENDEVVNVEDAYRDARFQSDYDNLTGYETKSVLCFPIKNREDEIAGVLQLLNSKDGKFSGLDEELLNAVSIQCALALQNAGLVEKLLETERVTSLSKMINFLIQDIKKPVLVSKRYAEHVKTKELPQDAEKVIDMLLDQLSQVVDLVQTTTSYSEGKAILRTSRVSLNGTLEDYSDRLDSYVHTRNCEIVNEFDADVKVSIDSREMFQVYNHLIRNACDAMPDGGNIHVSTKIHENTAQILFKDEGTGITADIVNKIFDPFMTYGKTNGTGLGLTIVKKIVEAHSGKTGVESPPEEGSTFIVELPVASQF